MTPKIALEEHFLSPGFEDYWKTTAGKIAPDIYRQALARLAEFGELRLAVMDRGGIERAVLSDLGPRRTDRARHRDGDPPRPRIE